LDQFEPDPERLDQIVRRLASIYDIARKHKVNPEELTELTKQIQAELDALRNADAEIEALESQLTEAQSKYNELAEKLSVSRTRAANSLQADITKQLQALGMHGAAFEVAVRRSHPGRFGIDDIEFLIATIPGSDTGALARIASGGELSRISLAIQVITAKTSNMPTLVFDEVDVGVGGATAEVVGSLLRKLGDDTQVICVTHLPQVAAQAHQHYVVIKETSRHAASTTVVQLTKEEKVSEIARMLGGLEKTDESITHAEAMMSNNKT
ncbi:MAG: DNA repair protein RecN, partial [Pseudomonadales bacterium]|nr:DNA repair protein RecN [Pseudomonadales bacterium]